MKRSHPMFLTVILVSTSDCFSDGSRFQALGSIGEPSVKQSDDCVCVRESVVFDVASVATTVNQLRSVALFVVATVNLTTLVTGARGDFVVEGTRVLP